MCALSCGTWHLVTRPGIKAGPLHRECGVLATGPPGRSLSGVLSVSVCFSYMDLVSYRVQFQLWICIQDVILPLWKHKGSFTVESYFPLTAEKQYIQRDYFVFLSFFALAPNAIDFKEVNFLSKLLGSLNFYFRFICEFLFWHVTINTSLFHIRGRIEKHLTVSDD